MADAKIYFNIDVVSCDSKGKPVTFGVTGDAGPNILIGAAKIYGLAKPRIVTFDEVPGLDEIAFSE